MKEEQLFRDTLIKTMRKVNRTGEPVLYSFTLAVPSVDPLLFWKHGREQYKGDSVYWADTGGHCLACLGSVFQQNAGQTEPFKNIEKARKTLMNEAVSCCPPGLTGTGLLFIGGFPFDPLQKRTALWDDFKQSEFRIPEWQLAKMADGRFFLTINGWLRKNSAIESEMAEKMRQMHERLNVNGEQRLDGPATLLYKEEIGINDWLRAVDKAIEDIKNKRLNKVVLSRIMIAESREALDPVIVLGRLHDRQPDCTLFAFERNRSIFIGATPEWLIKKSGSDVRTMCLAGTIKRGVGEKEDRALEDELLADRKNLAEHQFVVNRITEVMNKCCEQVESPPAPIIYKAGQVQHLCTPVTGKLKKGVSLLELAEALHPTPALGGLPKKEAVAAIRAYENYERGWYGAPIGWVDSVGDGAFAVAIRSGLIHGNKAVLFAGCGIVADSQPDEEYEETKIKFKPMLDALGDVQR